MIFTSAPALSILIYHRVLPRPDLLLPDLVDAAAFERQLLLLKHFFRVLPLGEAVRRLGDGTLPRRAACITFDDGYADNAEVALPLLLRHGLGACFFIATDFLDGGTMWNDSVIERVRHAAGDALDLSRLGLGHLPIGNIDLKRRAITTLLDQLKYLPLAQRQARVAQLRAGGHYPPRPDLMLRSAGVRALHRAGMEIGGHTASHPILATLNEAQARAEIADGKRALERIIAAPLRLFAYPNGKRGQDYGAREAALVRELGFEAAVTTDRGAARRGADPFQLPRFTPWDRGRLRFLLRLQYNLLRR